MADFRQKLNSRKLLLTLLVIFLATALLVTGQIDGTIWRDVVMGTSVIYLGSQAYVDKNSQARI